MKQEKSISLENKSAEKTKSVGSENGHFNVEEGSLSSFSSEAGKEIRNLPADSNTFICNNGNSQVDNNSIGNHAKGVLITADNIIMEKVENQQKDENVIKLNNKKQEQSMHRRADEEYAQSQDSSSSNKAEQCECTCSDSIFSGNAAHVDFFLPRLGLACKCTEPRVETIEKLFSEDDPSSLCHILRPWQVNFLKSMGITTVEQLILERKQYSRRLAKAMIQWRADKKMKPAKLKSCFVALHIWTQTAKVTMRTKRRCQISEGKSSSIVENCVTSTSDSASISTLASTTMSDSDEVMEI